MTEIDTRKRIEAGEDANTTECNEKIKTVKTVKSFTGPAACAVLNRIIGKGKK